MCLRACTKFVFIFVFFGAAKIGLSAEITNEICMQMSKIILGPDVCETKYYLIVNCICFKLLSVPVNAANVMFVFACRLEVQVILSGLVFTSSKCVRGTYPTFGIYWVTWEILVLKELQTVITFGFFRFFSSLVCRFGFLCICS